MAKTDIYTVDTSHLDFDPNDVWDKYAAERDKRIIKEGFGQYQDIKGDFSNFIDDHYVEPGFTRDPIEDDVEVVIIGGGFGGLLAGAHLRQAGIKDIMVIDKAGDFGGTWYWNRYPGAQCDVEAYVYMPLLEEMDYVPKERYSHAPEILQHSINIAKKFNLYEKACFQTEVTKVHWDEESNRWIIETDRKDQIKAKFVAMSNGLLTRPKLPGIKGIDKYKGHTFHTSRWDYDYTGGSSEGDLSNLADKRVAIIGTGATAVQCIPHLGAAAKELFVFQRTPSSVDVRNNAPTNPEWAAKLQPGWHRHRMENFELVLAGGTPKKMKTAGTENIEAADKKINEVDDGWTDAANSAKKMLKQRPKLSAEQKKEVRELADMKKMQEIRDRVGNIVEDQKTADALKAYYWQFCKRPCFHDEYLQTYNRPNVTLVDTKGQGVDEVTANGVIVDGVEYAVDCLIFATGFEVGSNYTSQSGYDVIGRDSLSLKEKWKDGLSTFHGLFSKGFPNCFFLGFTQTAVTQSVTHTLDEQAQHLAYVIKHAINADATTVETTQAAENDWVGVINSHSESVEQHYIKCTPGYYNNEGKTGNNNGFLAGQFGAGPEKFFRILKDWREEGNLQGLEIE
ncbi:MAG: NAD(P)/FAD-dependent oxidoreductase [Pseudomonadales bacterium]|nr:NAD(P)/FAD-dependent oxidoreductase [Pseudomonadales bacterium]